MANYRFFRDDSDKFGRVVETTTNEVIFPLRCEESTAEGVVLKLPTGFKLYIRESEIDKANSNPVITAVGPVDVATQLNNDFFFVSCDLTQNQIDDILSDVTLQLAYDNSPSKVINFSENTFFGLNGNKLFVSPGFEFAETVNVSRRNFIFAPQSGSAIADFRDASNNILLDINTDAININQVVESDSTTSDTLVLKKLTGQTSNLLTIQDQLGADVTVIDESGFLENFNDVQVSATGSAPGVYVNRSDGAAASFAAAAAAAVIRFDSAYDFRIQSQNRTDIDNRTGNGIDRVSVAGTGEVTISDLSGTGERLVSADASGTLQVASTQLDDVTLQLAYDNETDNEIDISSLRLNATTGTGALTVARSGHVIESLNFGNEVGWIFSRFGDSGAIILKNDDETLSLRADGDDYIVLDYANDAIEFEKDVKAPDTVTDTVTLSAILGQTSDLIKFEDDLGSTLAAIDVNGYYRGGVVEDALTKIYTANGNEWVDFAQQEQGVRINKRPDGGSGGWYMQFRSNGGDKQIGIYGGGRDVMWRDVNNNNFIRFINPSNNGVTRVDYDVDLEIIDSAKGIILNSPNGTRYRVTVDNAGNLITTSI